MCQVTSAAYIAILLFGCNHSRHPSTQSGPGPITVTLTWTDYDGQDSQETGERALFFLDGNPLGRGRAGFKAVLDRLSQLPLGSTVKMEWVERIPGPSAQRYALPFQRDDWGDLGEEYDQIYEQRKLRVVHQ